MRQFKFTGFLKESEATSEVQEAFRVLGELGMPFWWPGGARGIIAVRESEVMP